MRKTSKIFVSDFPAKDDLAKSRGELQRKMQELVLKRIQQQKIDSQSLELYRAKKERQRARNEEQLWLDKLELNSRERERNAIQLSMIHKMEADTLAESMRLQKEYEVEAIRKVALKISNRRLVAVRARLALQQLRNGRSSRTRR